MTPSWPIPSSPPMRTEVKSRASAPTGRSAEQAAIDYRDQLPREGSRQAGHDAHDRARELSWGEVGADVTTADGKVLYRAEVVDVGRDQRESFAAVQTNSIAEQAALRESARRLHKSFRPFRPG